MRSTENVMYIFSLQLPKRICFCAMLNKLLKTLIWFVFTIIGIPTLKICTRLAFFYCEISTFFVLFLNCQKMIRVHILKCRWKNMEKTDIGIMWNECGFY